MSFFNSYPYTDFHEMNLDWFLSQFKELTDDYNKFKNEITAKWTQTEGEWQELYNYVHDYFENLDVQEQVDIKLNQMVEDGTLPGIVRSVIGSTAAPIIVSSVSQMTNRERIYLLSTDNHLYAWSGSAFTDTGAEYSLPEGLIKGYNVTLSHGSVPSNHILGLEDKYIYGLAASITEEDISGLPEYGRYGALAILKTNSNPASRGYSMYIATYGSNTGYNSTYFAFANSGSGTLRWNKLGGDVITVGQHGDFPTIASAVGFAKDGDTILIYPGIYEEQIDAQSKTLHFVGIDKHSCVVIDRSGNYATPPFEIRGGSIRNLTIKETGEGSRGTVGAKPYCIHADFPSMSGQTIVLEDLILENNCHACIGIGIRYADIKIKNVEMKMTAEEASTSRGAFYIHTTAGSEGEDMKSVLMENVIAESASNIGYVFQVINNTTCGIEASFINNTVIAGGRVDNSIINNGGSGTQSFTDPHMRKRIISHGNNIDILNS